MWLGTFVAVLLLDVDSGLVVGIGLNVVLLVYRSLRVRMTKVLPAVFYSNLLRKKLLIKLIYYLRWWKSPTLDSSWKTNQRQ